MPTAAEREELRPSIIGFVVDRVREIDPSAAALRALGSTVPQMAACAVAEAAATMLALSAYGVSLCEDIASRSEVWCRHAATTK